MVLRLLFLKKFAVKNKNFISFKSGIPYFLRFFANCKCFSALPTEEVSDRDMGLDQTFRPGFLPKKVNTEIKIIIIKNTSL